MQNPVATIDQFTLADMQILMHAIERVSMSLNLASGREDMRQRSLISALVIECAEGGERDVEKLMDCAHSGMRTHQPDKSISWQPETRRHRDIAR